MMPLANRLGAAPHPSHPSRRVAGVVALRARNRGKETFRALVQIGPTRLYADDASSVARARANEGVYGVFAGGGLVRTDGFATNATVGRFARVLVGIGTTTDEIDMNVNFTLAGGRTPLGASHVPAGRTHFSRNCAGVSRFGDLGISGWQGRGIPQVSLDRETGGKDISQRILPSLPAAHAPESRGGTRRTRHCRSSRRRAARARPPKRIRSTRPAIND